MVHIFLFLFNFLLFFILSPGILLRLPKNGSKYTVAAVHGLVFAIAFSLFYNILLKIASSYGIM